MAKSQQAAPAASQPEPDDVDDSLFPSQDQLNEANDVWGGAQEEVAKGNPQGTFVMEVLKAELVRSQSSDKLQIAYQLKILTPGPFVNAEVPKYDGLGSQKQAAITQRQLQRLGIDTSKITLKTLPANLVDLIGKKVIANAKQNGEFYNVNFQKIAPEGQILAQAAGKAPSGNASGRTAGAASAARGGRPKF